MAGVSAAPPSSSPAIAGAPDNITIKPFDCCICLDLLYKPVVLACGHVSCFWCVHKSMDGAQSSRCAICRKSYNHFPNICQVFHHLLRKIAPAEYKRREKEVLEDEMDMQYFSPQLVDGPISERVHSEIENSAENPLSNINISSKESVWEENVIEVGICKQIYVDDVVCGLCKELLFQPAVLNCGHVYCRSCLPDVPGRPLKCQICQSLHPGGIPNVCFALNHFLEEQFPGEYATRKERERLEKINQQQDSSSSALQTDGDKSEPCSDVSKKSPVEINKDTLTAHYGVGCDSCGMFPITGKRYRCKDCKELIGFDLCEECYNTPSKLPGRFNQQHTPEHSFELDDSKLVLVSRMLRRFIATIINSSPEAHNNVGNASL